MKSFRHSLIIACLLPLWAGHVSAQDATATIEKRLGQPARVVFSTGFESQDWTEPWDATGHKENLRLVEPAETGNAPAHDGKALEVTIQKGGHYGMAPVFDFKKNTGSYPEEAYARYDICFAEDWRGYGGKGPGWTGTESGGWGGRSSDGTNGWSARGGIGTHKDGTIQMYYYTYHAEMRGKYGDNFSWDVSLETGRWYRVEQYCKINTPGEKDGILRAWVDGNLVLDKRDVMMRTTDALHLKGYWVNFYYGGKGVSEIERHAYLDNLVIAVPGENP